MSNTAQLVAHVGVDGMSAFLADIGRAHSAFEMLGTVANSALHTIELGATAALGAFALFTEESVKEAAKVELLTTQFGALAGSMDLGRKKMEDIRAYSVNAIHDFDDLAAAGRRLETAGLNSGRFLPMIDVLGKLLGDGPEKMMLVASAFDRIGSGGNFGQTMRVLQQLGIGYRDLMAQGIQVSAGHHITATSEQMLTAIENIFHRKFGAMGEYLRSTMAVKFSNVHQAWERLMASFGEAWFPLITHILNSLTPFLNFLSKSGEIEKIGAGFASLFNGMKDGGWLRVLMFGIATLESLPDIIRGVWNYIKDFMAGFGKILIGIVEIVISGIDRMAVTLHELAPIIQKIGDAAMAIGGSFGASGAGPIRSGFPNPIDWIREHWGADAKAREHAARFGGNAQATALGGPTHGMRSEFEKLLGGLPAIGDYVKDVISPRTDALMARYREFLNAPTAPGVDPRSLPMFNNIHEGGEEAEAVKETARNTASMAAKMDHFKRFALGGGDRGQVGVTVSEMYGRGGSGSVHFDAGRAGTLFERAALETAQEMVQGMRRHGVLGN